jgi:hypothetical protein
VPIALIAGESQIGRLIATMMLTSNDVFDLERLIECVLRQLTVFAPIAGPRTN